jgi:hypothetical protein
MVGTLAVLIVAIVGVVVAVDPDARGPRERDL